MSDNGAASLREAEFLITVKKNMFSNGAINSKYIVTVILKNDLAVVLLVVDIIRTTYIFLRFTNSNCNKETYNNLVSCII